MFRKSFSQKVGRVFEIVAYLLLVPAILCLFHSLLLIYLGLIVILIFSCGILLLIGYVKHSRGTLGEEKVIPFWVGTFFYNALPLLIVIFSMQNDYQNLDLQRLLSPYGLFGLAIVIWWIVAVMLSIAESCSELKEM